MATAFFLCGLPGSGKSTTATELQREHDAIVFSEDAWIRAFYMEEDVHDNDKREKIKAVQWQLAAEFLRRGVDVVFDWGVWARSERNFYRSLVAKTGAEFRLIYLDVPMAELQRRVALRNQNLTGHAFAIDPAEIPEYAKWFEPPTEDELGPHRP